MGRQHDNKANDCLLCWSEPAITTSSVLHIQFLTNQKAFTIWADAVFTRWHAPVGHGVVTSNCKWSLMIFFFPVISRGITFWSATRFQNIWECQLGFIYVMIELRARCPPECTVALDKGNFLACLHLVKRATCMMMASFPCIWTPQFICLHLQKVVCPSLHRHWCIFTWSLSILIYFTAHTIRKKLQVALKEDFFFPLMSNSKLGL